MAIKLEQRQLILILIQLLQHYSQSATPEHTHLAAPEKAPLAAGAEGFISEGMPSTAPCWRARSKMESTDVPGFLLGSWTIMPLQTQARI